MYVLAKQPRHNVALNGLSNVTVLRAPSEDVEHLGVESDMVPVRVSILFYVYRR